jgi:hypothetical protein
MGVRDLQIFKDALNGTVLAEGAMKSVEDDFGLQLGQAAGDIMIDIDTGDLKAFGFKSVSACLP